jgi:hypothetical protein
MDRFSLGAQEALGFPPPPAYYRIFAPESATGGAAGGGFPLAPPPLPAADAPVDAFMTIQEAASEPWITQPENPIAELREAVVGAMREFRLIVRSLASGEHDYADPSVTQIQDDAVGRYVICLSPRSQWLFFFWLYVGWFREFALGCGFIGFLNFFGFGVVFFFFLTCISPPLGSNGVAHHSVHGMKLDAHLARTATVISAMREPEALEALADLARSQVEERREEAAAVREAVQEAGAYISKIVADARATVASSAKFCDARDGADAVVGSSEGMTGGNDGQVAAAARGRKRKVDDDDDDAATGQDDGAHVGNPRDIAWDPSRDDAVLNLLRKSLPHLN